MDKIMFSKVYINGKLKPVSDQKVLDLLTPKELEVLDPKLPIKTAIYVYVNKIQPSDYICRCGTPLALKTIKRGFDIRRYCSKSCATKYTKTERRQSMLDRFGSQEEYNKYLKETQYENSMQKYGQTFQSLQSTRETATQTNLERYGVEHNSQIESVKRSRLVYDPELRKHVDPLNTTQARNSRAMTINSWSEKRHDEWIKSIKESTYRKSPLINYDFLETIDKKHSIEEVMNTANCSRMTAYRALEEAGFMNTTYTQDSIVDFIRSFYDNEIIVDTRKVIKPYEIDIYIPEFKLAIEYNGLYWHSSNSIEDDKKLSKYHLMKTEMCEEQGIHLFHIFENEWVDLNKQNIWKSMIKNKLMKSKRIFARKCLKQKITHKQAYDFMEENHLQGGHYGNEYYGLFYDDELVQVAIMGVSRYRKNQVQELIRLASKCGYVIVGGASKLLTGLEFISYGNRRWCSTLSNVYNEIGVLEGVSGPCYFYIDRYDIHHRSKYMKHKLSKLLDDFDPNLTETENCYKNGLRRIWDSGNLVYKIG